MTTTLPPNEPSPEEPRAASVGAVSVGREGAGDRAGVDPATVTPTRTVNRGWYALLLIPFVALLWLPFYARRTPALFGFPFFYWYQFAWVFLGAAITGLVYALTTTSGGQTRETPDDRRHPEARRP